LVGRADGGADGGSVTRAPVVGDVAGVADGVAGATEGAVAGVVDGTGGVGVGPEPQAARSAAAVRHGRSRAWPLLIEPSYPAVGGQTDIPGRDGPLR
jgi:hypothetical protein